MEPQARTILLFILMVSSAAEDVERNLTGIEGGSVTFSLPVLGTGFITIKGINIAAVMGNTFTIVDNSYADRLFWNNKTGHFTIRGLQKRDSAVYLIDPKAEGVSSISYKLTVYEPVAAPTVKTVDVSEESCSLLCLIDKSEETTLQWVKDKEVFNQSRSTLSLTLIISRKDLNSSFSCVARNPAEEKEFNVSIVSIEALCKEPHPAYTVTPPFRPYMIVIPIVLAVVVALVVSFLRQKYFLKNKKRTRETEGSENRGPEVVYTDVQINEATHSQGRNAPDSSGADERSNLSTVYDKVQAHRMSNAEREEHVYDQTVCPHA